MTITEEAAYLTGLVEGKELDPEAGEGKLWHVLSELVGDIAAELAALRKENENLTDSLEEVEVGLEYLEELFQDDYDSFGDEDDYDSDEDDGYYPFGSGNYRVVDDGDEEEEDDPAWRSDAESADGVFYEVECPNCGEEISFDDETLEEGSIRCPNCGAMLEFDTMTATEEDPAEGETEPENGKDDD